MKRHTDPARVQVNKEANKKREAERQAAARQKHIEHGKARAARRASATTHQVQDTSLLAEIGKFIKRGPGFVSHRQVEYVRKINLGLLPEAEGDF